jgi:sporulation protein YlmC with PRC-barrel domain
LLRRRTLLAQGGKRAALAVLAFSSLCIAGNASAQEVTANAAPGAQSQAGQGSEKASQPEGTQPQSQAQAPQSAQPQPAQPQPPQPEQGAAKTQTPTIVLDSQDVQGVLGKEALSRTGEKMGQIVDVIVDKSGRIRAAIIDFGGFLGVGSRKIAVDWRAVHFVAGGKTIRIILDLTREDVVGSHEYKPNDQITILEPKTEPPAPESAEPKPAPPAPEQ